MTATTIFTAVGAGNEILVDLDQPCLWTVAGTFVGSVTLERMVGGGWTTINGGITAPGSGQIIAEPIPGNPHETQGRFRFRCTSFVSGSITTTLTEIPAGCYVPTVVAVANVTAFVAYQLHFTRIGDMVIVGGKVDIQPATAAVQTSVRMSLPIPTSFDTDGQAGGCGSNIGVAGEVFAFRSEVGTSTVLLTGVPGHNTLRLYSFTMSYQIRK